MYGFLKRAGLFGLAGCYALSISYAAADDFYKGKNLSFVVGYVAGGGNDVYMRALARHLGAHIPGAPTVVPQNMPGAGSLVMMNYLYNVAPPDGTVIGLGRPELLLEPLYGNPNAKYDPVKFGWIGSPTRNPIGTCVTWHDNAVKTLDDAMQHETLVAGLGVGTLSDFYPRLLDATIGAKFKVMQGYADSGAAGIAMERKEVDGVCGLGIASIRATRPDWLDAKLTNVIAVFSPQRSPDYPEVKTVFEYAQNTSARQIFDLVFGVVNLDRPIMSPPGVPAARLAILREAFDATTKDPEYIADVARSRLDLSPASGEHLEQTVSKLSSAPKDVIDQILAIRNQP